MSNHLIDVQQIKNVYNAQKQLIKLGLLNIRSLSTKVLFENDLINDHNLGLLCLTETWLKPDEYIILNKSTPQDYCYKNEPRPKGKGGGVATIYNNILSISQKTGFKYNSFEVMVLHITLSREKSINDKSPVMFVLATLYRPPGHHTDVTNPVHALPFTRHQRSPAHHIDSCTTQTVTYYIGLHFPSSIALTTHTADSTNHAHTWKLSHTISHSL